MGRFLFLLLSICIFSCSEEYPGKIITATANIDAIMLLPDSTYESTPDTYGRALFEDNGQSVRMTLSLYGLPSFHKHAVHIHVGDCRQPGAIWNQGNEENFCNTVNLGEYWAKPKAGHVGNLKTNGDGVGELVLESELWSIDSENEKDLVGAVIVIHQDFEDFLVECYEMHQHVHNNLKIACGTIELQTTND